MFLRKCVDSYEKLDVLLYVQGRAEPVHVRDIARVSCLTVDDVQRAVHGLCGSGVLVQLSPDHVSEPRDETLRADLADFTRAYRDQPLTMLGSLSTQAIARQRAGSTRLRPAHSSNRSARRTYAR